jgi:hypothetical protein
MVRYHTAGRLDSTPTEFVPAEAAFLDRLDPPLRAALMAL